GGRMGIQRAGVELSRYLPEVHYLHDREIRAETLRTLLTARSAAAADSARAALVAGQDEAYHRALASLTRATERGPAGWAFGRALSSQAAVRPDAGDPRPCPARWVGGDPRRWLEELRGATHRSRRAARADRKHAGRSSRARARGLCDGGAEHSAHALRRRPLPRAADPGAVALRRDAPAPAAGRGRHRHVRLHGSHGHELSCVRGNRRRGAARTRALPVWPDGTGVARRGAALTRQRRPRLRRHPGDGARVSGAVAAGK